MSTLWRITTRVLTILALSLTAVQAQNRPLPPDDRVVVTAVAWSHEGSQIAAVGIRQPASQGYLRIIEVSSGQTRYALDPAPGGFSSVAWSPDDRFLAVDGYDAAIWVKDVENRRQVTALYGHQSTVSAVDWNADGTRLVSAGNWDGLTILWDMTTDQQLRTVEAGSLFPIAVDFSPDSQRIAVAGEGGFRIYPVQSELNTSPSWYFRELNIGALAWSHDGSRLAFGTQTFPSIVNPSRQGFAQLYLVDAASGAHLSTFPTPDQSLYGLVWSPDDRLIATHSLDGDVRLWDVSSGAQLEHYTGTADYPVDLSFSPYGGRLAYGGMLPGETAAVAVAPQVSGDGTMQLAGGAVHIVVPAPSAERLQALLNRCATNSRLLTEASDFITANQWEQFGQTVNRVPAGQLPPAGTADLAAMPDALQQSGQ